ncbi:MAG: SIS domain-containing protein [Acidobacteria bacterium]|nr:SIS domain-containing protein [Acidobacteriota bacterium]
MSNPPSAAAYLDAHRLLVGKLDLRAFEAGVALVRAKFEAGRQIITCGNGGSAYAASHFITDWNKMVNLATGKKFRGLSLCDNLGMVTAFANDVSFEEIFTGQLRAILEPDDLVIAISGSGNSPNVVNAVEYAHGAGADTLALVGYDGGRLKRIAKHVVWVPSFDMQLCEDVHLMFGHVVMKALCGTPIRE